MILLENSAILILDIRVESVPWEQHQRAMHSALVLGTPIYEFGTKKKFYAQLDENFYEFEFASIEKHHIFQGLVSKANS